MATGQWTGEALGGRCSEWGREEWSSEGDSTGGDGSYVECWARRELIVSRTWIQASILVMLFGFGVMGMLAYGANEEAPPVPQRIVDPGGATLFTAADIVGGQEIFLRNGLMEYGSIFGPGAYLGPDYTADALRRGPLDVLDQYGAHIRPGAGTHHRGLQDEHLPGEHRHTRVLGGAGARLPNAARSLSVVFSDPTSENGLRPSAIVDPERIRQLTAFFTWSAWASAAQRPGQTYSYTNNWPPEPLVSNSPTADSLVWSVLSLIALLGGIGLLFAAFGRWDVLGWRGRERQALRLFLPGEVPLTPAQRTTGLFFLVMAACSWSRRCSARRHSTIALLPPVRLFWPRSRPLVSLQPHPHEWLRFPGDVLMIAGGVLPLLYPCWLAVRYRIAKVTLEEPEHPLFTEVIETTGVR